MQDLDCPAINCNILTRDDESIDNKQPCQKINLFVHQVANDGPTKIIKNSAANQLCWDNPRLSFSDTGEIVELDHWSPKNFEAVWHCRHHYDSDFLVSEILLENNWDRRQEETLGQPLIKGKS